MRSVKMCILLIGICGCGDNGPIPPPLGPFEAMIAFGVIVRQSNGTPQTEIFLEGKDGRRMKVSQNATCFNRSPALSPAGDKVVYVSCVSPSGQDLFRVSMDDMRTQNITRTPDFEDHPLWSPDGSRIAYESMNGGKQDIMMVDSGGRQFTRITHPLDNLTLGGWSPNGNALVYAAQGQDSTEGQIFTVQVGTLSTVQLTSGSGQKAHPAWSTGGSMIAYVRAGRIRIMNANGSGDTSLSSSPDSVTGHLGWSSQDAWLIFEGKSSGRTDVYRISRDGTVLMNLTRNSFPASSPTLSSDDKSIAYVANLNSISKIYLMSLDGSEMRPLTPFNVDEFQPAWKR